MKQRELKKVLDTHAAWLEDENTGKRADFSGVNLSHTCLIGVNLISADLSGANLSGVKGYETKDTV